MGIIIDRRSILRWFAILELLISSVALVFTLLNFSKPDRIVLFGYSTPRLVITCFLLGAVIGSVVLVICAIRKSSLEKLVQFLEGYLARSQIFSTWLILFLLAFFSSALFVYLLFLTRGSIYGYFYQRLIPLAWWLTLTTLLLLLSLFFWYGKLPRISARTALLVVLVVGAGIAIYAFLWNKESVVLKDIFYLHREGKRLIELKNPYNRVLEGDMLHNEKYATLFPLFYELSASAQLLGLHDFPVWLNFWKIVFLLSYLGIAILLFYIPYRNGLVTLALFASFFWLFNRWSLLLIIDADIDFIPILLLLSSLVLLPRYNRLSYLLFGLSLAIKQISIFMLPIYLIWAWKSAQGKPLKQTFKAAIWIAVIPFVTSLPFLVWNLDSFVKSILFSATRLAFGASKVLSLDALLGLEGIPGKLPMLILMFLIYLLAWRSRIKLFTAGLLIYGSFVGFNSVFFNPYMVWLIPFVPLVAYEVAIGLKTQNAVNRV